MKSYRKCPWRSGREKLAICHLATEGGTYTYEELARVFGTEYSPPSGGNLRGVPWTAKEVGKLFGIGKGRVLSVQARAEDKLERILRKYHPDVVDYGEKLGDQVATPGVE